MEALLVILAIFVIVSAFIMPWINRSRIHDLNETVELLINRLKKHNIDISNIPDQQDDVDLKGNLDQQDNEELAVNVWNKVKDEQRNSIR